MQTHVSVCTDAGSSGAPAPPSGGAGGARKPAGGGGPLPPPSGTSRNPWDLGQAWLDACRGKAPPPRKDAFLPYVVVRANPSDRGGRPLPPDAVFWESPDIFVVPAQPPAGAPDVPANLGGMAQAGAPNTVYAHVWNLGRAPAFDVRVEFFWFNPTLGIEQADANLIGFTYTSLGARGSTRSNAVVRCPEAWVPTFVNGGHECLVVRAYAPISDPLGPAAWQAAGNRHVAQRNIAVLQGTQAQLSPITLQVAPGHSSHDAQIVTTQLPPERLPWMQLITMKRSAALQPPRVTPIVGITPPSAVLADGAPGLDLSRLSPEALAQLLRQQHRLSRAADPMQLQLVARAPALAPGEAHVVRVQQLHEGALVGGYTTVLLP